MYHRIFESPVGSILKSNPVRRPCLSKFGLAIFALHVIVISHASQASPGWVPTLIGPTGNHGPNQATVEKTHCHLGAVDWGVSNDVAIVGCTYHNGVLTGGCTGTVFRLNFPQSPMYLDDLTGNFQHTTQCYAARGRTAVGVAQANPASVKKAIAWYLNPLTNYSNWVPVDLAAGQPTWTESYCTDCNGHGMLQNHLDPEYVVGVARTAGGPFFPVLWRDAWNGAFSQQLYLPLGADPAKDCFVNGIDGGRPQPFIHSEPKAFTCVGYATSITTHQHHACVWLPISSSTSGAVDVNPPGYVSSEASKVYHGWTVGLGTPLNSPPQALWWTAPNSTSAYLLTPNTPGSPSAATDICGSGICGWERNPNGFTRALYWNLYPSANGYNLDPPTVLSPPAGYTDCDASGISATGDFIMGRAWGGHPEAAVIWRLQ